MYYRPNEKEDFSDESIIVILNKKASEKLKEYSVKDFSEIECDEIIDLTEKTGELIESKKDFLKGIDISKETIFGSFEKIKMFEALSTKTFRQILKINLKNKSKDYVLEAIKKIENRADVLFVGPDVILHTFSQTPNDTLFSTNQSAVSNLISLPQSWDITTGSSTVSVGIIDTGINGLHEDLVNVINNTNSRNFIHGYAETMTTSFDYNGHGTKVAGIIGAKGNNNTGVCGVCWNLSIVSLIVFGSSATGNASNVMLAIDYATSLGIPVLNMSGGWASDDDYYNPLLYYSIQNYPGLFVCASGNFDNDNDNDVQYYPTNYNLNNLISVGASTINDTKSQGSNYGALSVDLFAPGENIETTLVGGGYGDDSGTSMAAPFVAGVAALILSKYPYMSSSQIKQTLLNNVDEVSSLNGYCLTNGRLNAFKSLKNPLGNSSGHSHNYTYFDYGNVNNHLRMCKYGHVDYENHVWTSIMINSNGGYIINYFPAYECTKCGKIMLTIPS